jgi:hypothetical protein
MRTLKILFILTIFLFLAACQAEIDVRFDDDDSYLIIKFPEDQAAQAIENILSSGPQMKIINPEADLRNGEIFVTGEVKQQFSGEYLPGSLTLHL